MAKKDLRFIKYESRPSLQSSKDVEQLGDREWEVFEKIDGGNCQVRNSGGWTLHAGSRANFLRGQVVRKREWFGRLTKWMYSNPSLFNLPDNYVVYGEWSGNHKITYLPENTDNFFVLDVLNLSNGRFMEYGESRKFLEGRDIKGIRFLDILFRGKLKPEDLENLLYEKSAYYEGPKEGLVIKDYNSTPQSFYKLYHPEHSEKLAVDGQVDYLTSARFIKAGYRLIEEKNVEKIKPSDLIREVVNDIFTEESVLVPENKARVKLKSLLKSGELRSLIKKVKTHYLSC